jgi:hypothetical protein
MLFAGCSKSEDLPASRQLFGSPPQITSVVLTDPTQQYSTVSCDFTEIVLAVLCPLGAPPDIKATAPIQLFGKYTEAVFQVKVSDPEGIENVLFVGASYVRPSSKDDEDDGLKNESTLVLFDDGSANEFPQGQVDQQSGVGQECVPVEGDNCLSCSLKIYEVTSNDSTAADGTFTRAAAFFPPGSPDILFDCLMGQKKQVPIRSGEGDVTLSFRIDAVDRDGNVDTWDTNPTVHVQPYNEAEFGCTGDECGCCILLNPGGQYVYNCSGKPGLYSESQGIGVCSLF